MEQYVVTQYIVHRYINTDLENTVNSNGPEAWIVNDDNLAIKLGEVKGASASRETLRYQLNEGETFDEFVSSDRFPKVNDTVERIDVFPPDIPFGTYYPRVYRKTLNKCMTPSCCLERETVSLASLETQLRILHRKLEDIYNFVEPTQEQIETVYGHESRNLLMLACTEVESQFKLILEANGDGDSETHRSTRDFYKLCEILRLKEYSISDPKYPLLSSSSPFANWDESEPTQSLPWYNAYNKVKHHREANFNKAKIIHARDAIYACEILRSCQHEVDIPFNTQTPDFNDKYFYVAPRTWDQEIWNCKPWEKADAII